MNASPKKRGVFLFLQLFKIIIEINLIFYKCYLYIYKHET